MIESVKGVEPLAGDAEHKPERIYQLICEGACNYALTRQLDTAVAHGRMHMQRVSDAIRSELRRLKHTPHIATRLRNVFECTQCGVQRQYGNSV